MFTPPARLLNVASWPDRATSCQRFSPIADLPGFAAGPSKRSLFRSIADRLAEHDALNAMLARSSAPPSCTGTGGVDERFRGARNETRQRHHAGPTGDLVIDGGSVATLAAHDLLFS